MTNWHKYSGNKLIPLTSRAVDARWTHGPHMIPHPPADSRLLGGDRAHGTISVTFYWNRRIYDKRSREGPGAVWWRVNGRTVCSRSPCMPNTCPMYLYYSSAWSPTNGIMVEDEGRVKVDTIAPRVEQILKCPISSSHNLPARRLALAAAASGHAIPAATPPNARL